jgi:hypothetical protein
MCISVLYLTTENSFSRAIDLQDISSFGNCHKHNDVQKIGNIHFAWTDFLLALNFTASLVSSGVSLLRYLQYYLSASILCDCTTKYSAIAASHIANMLCASGVHIFKIFSGCHLHNVGDI